MRCDGVFATVCLSIKRGEPHQRKLLSPGVDEEDTETGRFGTPYINHVPVQGFVLLLTVAFCTAVRGESLVEKGYRCLKFVLYSSRWYVCFFASHVTTFDLIVF